MDHQPDRHYSNVKRTSAGTCAFLLAAFITAESGAACGVQVDTIDQQNADEVERLIVQLHDLKGYQRGRAADQLSALGKAAVQALCETLRLEEDFEVAAVICQVLGKIGDKSALPCILSYIDRDLDQYEKVQQEDDGGDHSPKGMSKFRHWYKTHILPSVATIGDERVVPRLIRLRHLFDETHESARSHELVEGVLMELKLPSAIPFLVESFCSGTASRRSAEACKALLAMGLPVADYLLRDFAGLAPETRRERMTWLVHLAGEGRTRYIVGRYERGTYKLENAMCLELSNAALRMIYSLAEDEDVYLRYHVAQLCATRSKYHADDAQLRTLLESLAEDPDASVRAAALSKTNGDAVQISRRPIRFGADREKILWTGRGTFEVTAPPLTTKDLELRLAIDADAFSLTAPQYRFNEPIWLRLDLRTSPWPSETAEQRRANALSNRSRPEAVLASVKLLLRDALGKERTAALFRFPRDERCYWVSGFDRMKWAKQDLGPERVIAYVNLIECVRLHPGQWQVSAVIDHEISSPVSFTINSVYPPQRAAEPRREKFNPFAANPYVEVLWSRYIGTPHQWMDPVLVDGARVFVPYHGQVIALERSSGHVNWMFSTDQGRVTGVRREGDAVVVDVFPWTRNQNVPELMRIQVDPSTGKQLREDSLTVEQARSSGFRDWPPGRGVAGLHHAVRIPIGQSGRHYLVEKDGTVALEEDGEIRRRFLTDSSSWRAASDDGRYLFRPTGMKKPGVVCYDLELERILWRNTSAHPLPGLIMSFTRMVMNDGVLYGTYPYGGIVAMDPATGEEQWVFDRGSNQGTLPAFDDDVIYGSGWGGGLWAISRGSGRLLWHIPVRPGGEIWQVTADEGVVYVHRSDGYLLAIKNKLH